MMVLFLALAWYVTLSTWLGNESKYEELIEQARHLEGKGLYLDAIDVYKKAGEITGNTIELAEYIADDYYAMGDYKKYRLQLESILNEFGAVEADVEKLVSFHENYSSKTALIECVRDLHDKYPDSKTINKYYDSLKGIYSEKYLSFDYIGNFNGKYAVFGQGGKKGLISQKGSIKIEPVYDNIIYNGKDNDMIAVEDGGKTFFINIDGYKTGEPEIPCQYLGCASGGRILAKRDGKYGYLDKSLKQKTEFIYENATPFYGGIGAVMRDGKWALMDKKSELVTEYIYDGIIINEFGICSLNGVIGVRQGDVCFMVDKEGERIGQQTYQDMKGFVSEQPCAVCVDGMWGYADETGNIVIQCQYDDACSFSNGYAPVKKNGLWGYIDLNGYVVIDFELAGAGNITSQGVAPISHKESWTLMNIEIKK